MKDVYIIDYAVIDTLGSDIQSNYANMLSLAKGPQTITRYDLNEYPNVLTTKGYEMSFYPTENLLSRLQNDLVNQLSAKNTFPMETAVIFGAFPTSGGYAVRKDYWGALEAGQNRFSPTRLFTNNNDLIGAVISRKLKLEGLSTSLNAACSSSMFNLHYTFNCIQSGAISSALVGSIETPLHAHTQYYWQSTSAISTKHGGICKPFDKSRDGFLQAEGGSLWWLCDEDTVKQLNLKPKAKLLSIVASAKCHGDASLTAHDKSGEHQIKVINQALKMSNKKASDMSYFNAHATSTFVGDDIEFEVFKKVFDDIDIPCVSFKGYLGHTLSACGMIESAYGLEAVKHNLLQPNFNLTDPLSDDPRLITSPKKINGKTFMKASFGFGGRTAIAIFEGLQ
jgi:3-oxoacyl-[acyl-carrier-protein] synthase II